MPAGRTGGAVASSLCQPWEIVPRPRPGAHENNAPRNGACVAQTCQFGDEHAQALSSSCRITARRGRGRKNAANAIAKTATDRPSSSGGIFHQSCRMPSANTP